MVNYSVKLYAKAARDLDGIYAYIMNELLAPDAADNLIKDIEKAIFEFGKYTRTRKPTKNRDICL